LGGIPPEAAAIRDRRGVVQVLRPEAADPLSDVAPVPVPVRDLVLPRVPVLILAPADERPAPGRPRRPFAK
jgi:hypothetical protein